MELRTPNVTTTQPHLKFPLTMNAERDILHHDKGNVFIVTRVRFFSKCVTVWKIPRKKPLFLFPLLFPSNRVLSICKALC